jgi:integrase
MDLRDRTDLPYRFFKPKNSNRWNIRFSISGFPQIKYALGTADDDEALRIAADKYQDAVFQAKHGILAANGSFKSVAKDYVKTLYAEAERDPSKLTKAKYADAVVSRYLIGFFKTIAVTAITYGKMQEYTGWRRHYWTTGDGADLKHLTPYWRNGREVHPVAKHEEATAATLKRENVILRGVFKHAVRKGLIKAGDVPQQELPKVNSDKRPAFSKEQYSKLVLTSEQRLAESVGQRDVLFARGMLHNFILIATDTGMRPKELFNLNWGHIEGFEEALSKRTIDAHITIHAYGKGKKPAPLVPMKTVITHLEQIQKIYRMRFQTLPTPETPVFCNIDGGRITTFNKSLNKLLEACDLCTDAFGRKFSSYSFRHTYATWAMQDPLMDVYKLAINMRTSVAMVERYYSKVMPEDHAAILRGDHKWAPKNPPKGSEQR